MRINRCIRQQLLAAGLGVSLLQPIALGAVGSILLGAAAGEVSAQQSLNTEAIARIAQGITVRIEGATQGSGVLVKRDGNRYTVLTAWHVVSAQRPGEELAIYTPDGRSHALDRGSINRVGQVDLAVLTFYSTSIYELAQIGDTNTVSSGASVYVAGFPLPTSSVPARLFRFRSGLLEANPQVPTPNGYQLLYSNPTLPGMSGGAVLNENGELVGIHASAERADQLSERSGKAVATGTNQGVPINYYTQSSALPIAITREGASVKDYLIPAKALHDANGREEDIVKLTSQALKSTQSAEGLFYRASAKYRLKDYQGAIDDLGRSVAIDPGFSDAWMLRGLAKYDIGDYIGACSDIRTSTRLGSVDAWKHKSKACDYLHLDVFLDLS